MINYYYKNLVFHVKKSWTNSEQKIIGNELSVWTHVTIFKLYFKAVA